MKIKELNYDDRPRERLMSLGADALSDSELLAILLRTGTKDENALEVSRRLLAHYDGNLGRLCSAAADSFKEVKGVGPGKAATLLAAFELGRRCALAPASPKGVSYNTPASVARLMFKSLKGLDHEQFWVLFLNRSYKLIRKERLSIGGMSATVLDKKVLLRRALECKAMAVILVHNHPSGDPRPAGADMLVTSEVRKALSMLNIELLDHLIFSDTAYFSFSEEKIYAMDGLQG